MNDLLGTVGDGRYRLVEPLGRGGMGTVYSAIQEKLGRRVAIKILDPRLAEDRQQLARFQREAEIVAAIGHPNIVQVTDFQYPEKDGDEPFLVMELLRGESLGMLLAREQVITATRCAFVAAQVLSALIAAHRAGVVHRDIKPENIFLLSDAAVPDTVKVLDFGIAKLAVEGQAKLTGTGAMLGTPAFMAPEQARGESDVDARADVYAVGATMYQALSGRLPYDAPSIPALLFAIVEKTPPPLHVLRPDLPKDLVAVVERAMTKDRAMRFQNADEMRRALAPWSGLPATIPPPISATAETIASGPIASGPRENPTPIVVHHPTPAAPAPARSATTTDRPPAKNNALRNMIFVVALLAIAGMTTIGILLVVRSPAPTAAAAVPNPPPIPSALSSLIANPPIDPAPQIASAVPSAIVQQHPIAATTNATIATNAIAISPPPTGGKRYGGGARGRFSSSDYSGCEKCDWQSFNQALRLNQPAIGACFAASVHEPPIHETPYYEVTVSPSGAITAIHNAGSDSTPPNLDRCLLGVLQSMHLSKPGGDPGNFKIGFVAECQPGMANIPGACDK